MWRSLAILRQRIGLLPSRQYSQSRSVSIYKKYRGLTFPSSPTSILNNKSSGRMDLTDGPLVWVDCEMTGLDYQKDKLLEIAVLITDGNLELVDEGIQYVIHTEKDVLDGMSEWCVRQHGQSGLTQACLESPHSIEDVSKAVLQYVKEWIPTARTGVLAGNTVHMDRIFLAEAMPELIDWLHYRIVDVSSIKELARRWYGADGIVPRQTENTHRALDDIRCSIQELQWYRENIFLPSRSDTPSTASDSVQEAS